MVWRAGVPVPEKKKKKNVIQQVLHNGQLFLTGWLADRLVWLIW